MCECVKDGMKVVECLRSTQYIDNLGSLLYMRGDAERFSEDINADGHSVRLLTIREQRYYC